MFNLYFIINIMLVIYLSRQRLEMIERQKKEEEERIARRKRVEAIMKRTRGGNGSQANTPTKVNVK